MIWKKSKVKYDDDGWCVQSYQLLLEGRNCNNYNAVSGNTTKKKLTTVTLFIIRCCCSPPRESHQYYSSWVWYCLPQRPREAKR